MSFKVAEGFLTNFKFFLRGLRASLCRPGGGPFSVELALEGEGVSVLSSRRKIYHPAEEASVANGSPSTILEKTFKRLRATF